MKILVLLICLFLCIPTHEQEPNIPLGYCDTPETISVQNYTKHDVDNIIKVLLNKVFSYDTMNVIVVTREPDETNFVANIVKLTPDKMYMIFISSELMSSYYYPVLSHEIAHLVQFELGYLKTIDPKNGIYLYVNNIIDATIVPYKERRYEIDAFEIQNDINDALLKEMCECP
jgi:hypothetical protein